MKEVLTYSLHHFPPAIANHGGTLANTVKAKLRNYLEAVPPAEKEIPSLPTTDCAWVLDGMALIQQIKEVPTTFGALARQFFNSLVSIAVNHGVKRIDIVVDRYPDLSIKGNESDQRALSGANMS